MQDLGTLGGPDAIAFLLSERGQVGGWSYTNSVPNPSTGIPTVDPFLWENGTMTDLGTLGGTFGSPSALNSRGQVVGVSNLTGDQTSELFLWEKGKLTDLTTQSIGGTFLVANAISDAGQIVGGGAFPGRVFDASLWKNGVLTDLGTLDDDCYSIAVAINPRGQVVGSSFACDFSIIRGFLWEHGSMVDLNTLIPPDSGLQLMLPETINDSGEIAGNGVLSGSGCADADVCGHAFVLIPAGGDGATGATTATQNDDAPVNRRPMTGTQLTATSKEIMARINARIGRRHGIPGLGARLRK